VCDPDSEKVVDFQLRFTIYLTDPSTVDYMKNSTPLPEHLQAVAKMAAAEAQQLLHATAPLRGSIRQPRPNSSNDSSTTGVIKATAAFLNRLPSPRAI
jgi:hypothetical protein